MTKKCSKCKLDLDESLFSVKKNGSLQTYCITCNKQYQKEHYLKNKEKYIERNRKTKQWLRDYVADIKQNTPCADCGKKYHAVCMDFDHLDASEKDYEISQLVHRGSKSRIDEEMAKCEVVCANCHRLRTHNRRQ